MKIGIVCYPTFGGSGVLATELGKALADRGHQVHFITYNQPARFDSFNSNLFYHEVAVSKYPLFEYSPYESALAGKIVDVVQYEKLDLLHVHYAIPHASAAFMAKQILLTMGIHIPVITTLHGTDITLVGKDITFKPVVKFSINASDGVTAVSESLKNDTCHDFEIGRDKITVIPNFVDLKRFNHQAKNHFKMAIAPNNEKILIHTSNFRKVKRVQDVVQIFYEVQKQIPSRLLMVGDGPERSTAEIQCRELGISDEVRFLGKQDAIEEILSVSDLFLMPSETESFGLAALEAMACKVPVISSNSGGLPEVNVHGSTGYMSEVGDTKSMAAHAISLLSNEAQLTEFKLNALARANEFDIENITPMYEAYYNEVLNKVAVIG